MAAERFERVVASDLQRAWRTAEIAFPARAVERHPALRERSLGDWEGAFRSELVAKGQMPLLLAWSVGPPGGESQQALARRVLRWLADQPPADTLAVAHGGVLRVIEGLVHGVPLLKIGSRPFANTEVATFDLRAEDWARLAAQAEVADASDLPTGEW
jgi:broad specificity phosphatase PhoE